ncbi:MAG: hypothetical protein AAGE80_05595 [Pseudomonadota bacterium]
MKNGKAALRKTNLGREPKKKVREVEVVKKKIVPGMEVAETKGKMRRRHGKWVRR